MIGSVIAAVSPAVIVPRMIHLIDEGYGSKNQIPQMILAGASVDDVFVIVVFTVFTALAATGTFSIMHFVQIPMSIILGILLGACAGMMIVRFFNYFCIKDPTRILMILSVSFLLLEIETRLQGYISISGLLAIMSMGVMIKHKNQKIAVQLSSQYNKLWKGAEVFLFVLVGATVDLKYVQTAGFASVLLIVLALVFRMSGVAISLLKTNLSMKEKFNRIF